MHSVNISICTVIVSEMELVLVVQKPKGNWNCLPSYYLQTEQALKMYASCSGNNFQIFVLYNADPKLFLARF